MLLLKALEGLAILGLPLGRLQFLEGLHLVDDLQVVRMREGAHPPPEIEVTTCLAVFVLLPSAEWLFMNVAITSHLYAWKQQVTDIFHNLLS